MKPDEIISLKHSITQFLNPVNINHQGKKSGFIQRLRGIRPFQLVCCLIAAMSKNTCSSIASLHRQFNGMQLAPDDFVAYKPFHNQLRKPEFVDFMKAVTQQAVARFLSERVATVPLKLQRFAQIILHDGTSFAVHKGLREHFPARFHQRTPAAVECHLSLSLFDRQPLAMTISADTSPEQRYLPEAETLRGKLLIADAGYLNLGYFSSISGCNGHFLMRGKSDLNPRVLEVSHGRGKSLPHLSGRKLKEITRRHCRTEVLDMKVEWKYFSGRIIRRWFAEEKRFCCWVTNLSEKDFSADEIMQLYRTRWQIELFFKELKSQTTLRGFVTRQKAIAEGLIWASLLSAVVRRHIATFYTPEISFQKMAGNVDVWFLPIIQALVHGAISEVEGILEWAIQYLSDNACLTRQRKRCKNKSLREICNRFNA